MDELHRRRFVRETSADDAGASRRVVPCRAVSCRVVSCTRRSVGRRIRRVFIRSGRVHFFKLKFTRRALEGASSGRVRAFARLRCVAGDR